MFDRQFLKNLTYKDLRAGFNIAVIFVVLALTAFLSYRLGEMGQIRSREQLQTILIAIGLMGFFLFSLYNITLGLFILFFASVSLNLGLNTGTDSQIVLTIILVILLTAVWIVRMLVFEKRLYFRRSILNLPLLLLLVAILVSWIASIALNKWNIILPSNILLIQAGQYAMFVLSAAAFWLFANHPVSDKTLKIWIASLIVYGFISFTFEAIARKDFYSEAMNGAALMWPVVLLVGQLLFNPQLDKRWRLVGYGALVVWVFWALTWSFVFKGGWMPAVFAITILIFLKNTRLGLLIGVLGGLYLLWSNFGQTFFSGETASLFRPLIWLDVIRIGLRSPIIGLGPAVYMFHWADPTFNSITFQVSQTYAWNRFNFAPPSHNLYVDIFAQSGIIGIGIFIWFLAAVAIYGWRLSKSLPPGFHSGYINGVFAGFAAMAIASAPFADWLIPFVYNIGIAGFAHSVYSWIFLGTMVALDHRLKEESVVPAS